jgi:hypothetical protein
MFRCPYCRGWFRLPYLLELHKAQCADNPVNKPKGTA